MENTEKIDFSNRPKDEKGVITHCPWFIFGNENSADTDLKKRFEVIDEKKD